MPKTYSSIWLHSIWTTKDRLPMLDKSFRYKLFKHIKEYGSKESIYIDIINGVGDHVHCLFRIKPIQSASDVMRKIKSESSYWVNKNMELKYKFGWQQGYGIFSVSEKDIENVRAYIYNQEKHHRNMDYRQEVKRLVKS